MSIVYCSAKLSSLIGISRTPTDIPEQPATILGHWNAHLFSMARRKCIIVTHKPTLYTFIRLDVLKKDLADLKGFFIGSLLRQLMHDRIMRESQTDYWLDKLQDISFRYSDNDKKVIGTINEFIYSLKVGIVEQAPYLSDLSDLVAATYINNYPMRQNKYKTQVQAMLAFVAELEDKQ